MRIGIVGALILLVACFNFMNLAAARASLRAREISLRRCVGASRKSFDPAHMSTLSVRIGSRDMAGTLAFIDRTWRTFAPVYSSQRYFLSARYATYYETSQRQGLMLEIFVALAILIACLGLFGLTVFTAALVIAWATVYTHTLRLARMSPVYSLRYE